MWLATRMATPAGRGSRVVVGLVLIGAGAALNGLPGLVVAVVGAVPLLAGLTNVCLVAPLVRAPFRGPASRSV